jgi:hypothetical protein
MPSLDVLGNQPDLAPVVAAAYQVSSQVLRLNQLHSLSPVAAVVALTMTQQQLSQTVLPVDSTRHCHIAVAAVYLEELGMAAGDMRTGQQAMMVLLLGQAVYPLVAFRVQVDSVAVLLAVTAGAVVELVAVTSVVRAVTPGSDRERITVQADKGERAM